MQIVTTKKSLSESLKPLRDSGKTIGFVPTMGALHNGHIGLVKRSVAENDITVVSIFVNPTQFNNAGDLDNYPRTPEADARMLEEAGANFLFLPSVDEMYPSGAVSEPVELGALETVMEGAFRPGHFQGVATIVKRLFDAVQPRCAYFGEKDFQQLAVIRHLVKREGIRIDIIACPTAREASGLAMSSRNMRLGNGLKQEAAFISKALFWLKDSGRSFPLPDALQKAAKLIELPGHLKVEYLEIAEADTLQPVKQWTEKPLRAFAAVYAGDVRLIDNVAL